MGLDRKIASLIAVFFSVLLLSACEYSLAQDISPPPGSELSVETPTPEAIVFPTGNIDLLRGEAIYAMSCAPCHGQTGLGDGEQAAELPFAVPAIADPELARQRSPLNWYGIISQGNLERFMPPFSGSLSSDERWDVVAYVYRLSQDLQFEEASSELFIGNCADCHGETGVGDGPQADELTAGLPDFTALEFTAEKTQAQYFSTIAENPEDEFHAFSFFTHDQAWALTALVQSIALGGVIPVRAQSDRAEPNAEVDQSEGLSFVGQVSNASGGNLPEGMEIALHAFDQLEEKFSQISHLEKSGQFTFEPILPEDKLVYVASIDYADLKYFSEILTAQDIEEDGKLHFSIIVYDRSTDISKLSVERLNIVIEFPSAERIQLVQQVLIGNDSEFAVAPAKDGDPLLAYYLPPDAGNLTFEQGGLGDRYMTIDGGFGDMRAVLPGQNSYQILYAFDLPYRRALDYEQAISLPTQDVLVFLPSGNVALEGEDFAFLGEQLIEGVSYQAYRFDGDLQVGDQIHIELRGPHPIGGGVLTTLGYDRNFQIGLLLFAASLVFAWRWLREKRFADEGNESPNAIMDAIIELDASYENAELPERSYTRLRMKLKNQLGRALDDGREND